MVQYIKKLLYFQWMNQCNDTENIDSTIMAVVLNGAVIARCILR